MHHHLPSAKIRILSTSNEVKDPSKQFHPAILQKYSDHQLIVKSMYTTTVEAPHTCDCDYCTYDGTSDETYVFDTVDDIPNILELASAQANCGIEDLEYSEPVMDIVAILVPQQSVDTTPLFSVAG